MIDLVKRVAVGTSLMLAGWLVAGPARADSTIPDCEVSSVQYDRGRLVVWCRDPNPIYAFVVGYGGIEASCPQQTMDTLKIWTGMALAALVSHKNVAISFGSCGGGLMAMQGMAIHN